MDYKPHPYAELFPMMGQKELASLAKDIAANGQQDAIVIDEDDLILDGRNRLKACAIAEVEPWVESFRGGDKLAFVISKNIERRHLDDSQRALIAGKIATMKNGGDRKSENQSANLQTDPEITLGAAAETMNVSERSAAHGKKVATEGAQELQDAVASGEVSVSDAASIATLPKSVQKKAVKAKRAGKATTVKKAASEIAPQEPPKPKMKTLKDSQGNLVPQRLFTVFKAAEHFIVARKAYGALSDALTLAHRELPKGLIDPKEIDGLLRELYRKIEAAEPHIVCPKCRGDGFSDKQTCKPCGGYGFTRTGGQR